MAAKIPDSVIQKIQGFCDNRTAGDENLSQSSTIYRQVVDLTNKFLQSSSQRKGGLNVKQKLLVLVGIHATHGTEQSIHFAVTAALQVGLTADEIMESLDLALLTGGGTAVARVQFASNVLAYYNPETNKGKLPDEKAMFEFATKIAS